MLAAFKAHPDYSAQEKVRIDVLKRFGYHSTESNGDPSDYLPWYRKRPDQIKDWISMDEWIHGETGGYLRVLSESRNWFEQDFPVFLDEAGGKLADYRRTDQHASHILEGLETGRTYHGHFNTRHGGIIRNLPADCIIESPGFLDRFGIDMVEGITLPDPCAATCMASVKVQRMGVKAAMTGDVDRLKQAVLHDPLVGAVCTPEDVWQMVDEMPAAQAKWLPQFADAIPTVKERLKNPRAATHEWQGAARLNLRSFDEVRAAQRAKEAAADRLGTR